MSSSTPTVPSHLIPLRVGFTLHYWPHQFEKLQDHDQPFLAHVVHVNPNGTINVVVYNEIGVQNRRINVHVAQGIPAVPGQCAFSRS